MKSELRKIAKNIRKSLDINEISNKIIFNVEKMEIYQKAKNVMIFYPLDDEINLLGLISNNKNFYLPRINGDEMEVCPYKIGDTLLKSSFKTLEPTSKSVNKQILDIVFVPALMADLNKNRLGYGKGFYDRFSKDLSAKTILPISSKLIVNSIPTNNFDLPVNQIITELLAF